MVFDKGLLFLDSTGNKQNIETKNTETNQRINWHNAYCIAIKAELADYLDDLEFLQEHVLNTEPLRTDMIIIKKTPGLKIEKKIAEDFAEHNIIEFKSPSDTLGVYSYLKTFGYTGIYQSINQVPEKKISLTMVCSRKPRNLISYLTKNRREVTNPYPGIYKVKGEHYPVQIIENIKLPKEESIWLRNLRGDISENEISIMAEHARTFKHPIDLSMYLYVLYKANKKFIEKEGGFTMNKFENLLEEIGLTKKWIAEGKAEGKFEGMITGMNNTLFVIKGLKNNIPIDQLSKEADLPFERIEEIRAALFA